MGELAAEKHVKYIIAVEKKKDSFESVVMEHLRMNGAYWGLTTLDLLGKLHVVDVDEVVPWIISCQHESGGFGGNVEHDPYILYTLSAVQVLALFDKLDVLDIEKVSNFFCCVGALAIMGLFTMWTRAFSDGGYVSAKSNLEVFMDALRNFQILIMIDRVHWINKVKLVKFILDCQSIVAISGHRKWGISDRPDDAVDVYHTYFGVAGISLLEYPGLKAIDPAYALPVDAVNRIFLRR